MSNMRRIEGAAEDTQARQLRLLENIHLIVIGQTIIVIHVICGVIVGVGHLVAPFKFVITNENGIADLNAGFLQRFGDAERL